VTYDVYFGKDALPGTPVSAGQTATTYDPGILEGHSTYHWKVVVKDDQGGVTSGPEWTFTTGADAAPPTVSFTYPSVLASPLSDSILES